MAPKVDTVGESTEHEKANDEKCFIQFATRLAENGSNIGGNLALTRNNL